MKRTVSLVASNPGTGAYTPVSNPLYGGDLFISVKAVEWVFFNSKSSGNARNILLVIAAHISPDETSWPSFERIVRLSNTSRPTVAKAIAELEELGELEVNREEGTGNVYTLPKFKPVNAGKVLEQDQLSSTPKPVNPSLPKELVLEKLKAEEGSSSLPLCQEERRAIPKPVKEPKVRKGFVRIPPFQINVPMRLPKPKPPQDWDWFAGMWHRYTEVFPVGTPNCWEELEARLKDFSKAQIENRVSRWIDQADRRITGWTALDFLRDCALMLDEKEAGDIQSIVNEE